MEPAAFFALACPGRALRLRMWCVVGVVLAMAAGLAAQTPVARTLRQTGPNANRLNVAILGDGYTVAQQEQFFADAQRKLDALVASEAFAAARDLINGVAIFTASNESGTDVAGENVRRDTYYDTGFGGSVNDRLLTVATAAGRTRAETVLRQRAPDCDISILLVNTPIYGGAGGSLVVTSLHSASDEIVLHEIGHSFARLTDEYVDAGSAPYYPAAEFPNSTQKTARAEIPWRDFLLESTPLPSSPIAVDANSTGAWEGSQYRAQGFFRPTYDSKMRTLGRPFGPVNVRAFATAIHQLNLNNATALPGTIALNAVTSTAAAGGTLSLGASVEGTGPFTYQWLANGKFLPGQTASTLSLSGLSAAQVGTYAVEVTNAVGVARSAAAGVTARVVSQGAGASATYALQIGAPQDPGRLINLSILTTLASDTDEFSVGVVVGGAGTTGGKPMLVRVAGPSLAALGVGGAHEDPRLEFFAGETKIGENENWGGTAATTAMMNSVGAFSFGGPASRDAAFALPAVASGACSAKVSGRGAGKVLAELYDATPAGQFTATTPRLINVSVLKHIGDGLTMGFVIGGSTPRSVLLRAVGPTLAAAPFGVTAAAADTRLALYSGATEIGANDNWGGTAELTAAFAQVGAFALPAGSRDAALRVTLPPGAYTLQVTGVGGTGTALVEVYEMP